MRERAQSIWFSSQALFSSTKCFQQCQRLKSLKAKQSMRGTDGLKKKNNAPKRPFFATLHFTLSRSKHTLFIFWLEIPMEISLNSTEIFVEKLSLNFDNFFRIWNWCNINAVFAYFFQNTKKNLELVKTGISKMKIFPWWKKKSDQV